MNTQAQAPGVFTGFPEDPSLVDRTGAPYRDLCAPSSHPLVSEECLAWARADWSEDCMVPGGAQLRMRGTVQGPRTRTPRLPEKALRPSKGQRFTLSRTRSVRTSSCSKARGTLREQALASRLGERSGLAEGADSGPKGSVCADDNRADVSLNSSARAGL